MSANIHDGERIKVLLMRQGMSMTDFSKAMEIPLSTMNGMLKRENWQTGHLRKASEVLGLNLFEEYVEQAKTHSGYVILKGEEGPEVYGLERIEDIDWSDFETDGIP